MRFCLADERPHLRLAILVVGALDEDQTWNAARGGALELVLRRRNAGGVLGPVVIAEEAEIDSSVIDLLEIELVRLAIPGRQFLEQEHVEIAPEEWIRANVIGDCPSLGGELLLRAADEDQPVHFLPAVGPRISPSNPSVSVSSARMSARISSSVRSGFGL